MEASKAVEYSRQHAEDVMVKVHHKRFAQEGCSNRPSFDVEGNKVAIFCRLHAEDGMLKVVSKCCTH